MGAGEPLFHHSQFDLSELAATRGGTRVSVCIPARNEERTVASVVGCVRRRATAAGGGADLVDEIVVVDDSSSDATAELARRAGAVVVQAKSTSGKGKAMDAGVRATTGDIVVFLDADVENFDAHFLSGLVGPLVHRPELLLVKAFYERPLDGAPSGGGRVTELVARPAIDLLFPALAHIRQPLAGETAVRRSVLGAVRLEEGYGVELGLLVDVAATFGTGAIAQVDLGCRVHRNRPLEELRPQATDVLRAALARAGAGLRGGARWPPPGRPPPRRAPARGRSAPPG